MASLFVSERAIALLASPLSSRYTFNQCLSLIEFSIACQSPTPKKRSEMDCFTSRERGVLSQRGPAAQAHWVLVPQSASALEAKHAITPPFRESSSVLFCSSSS